MLKYWNMEVDWFLSSLITTFIEDKKWAKKKMSEKNGGG